MLRRAALLLTLFAALPALALPPELPPGLTGGVVLPRYPERIELQPLDVASLLAEDLKREARGAPPRYAVAKPIAPVTPTTHGTWTTLQDGRRVWRYAIHAKGATSIEAGFTQFHLPEGTVLYVYGNDGRRVRGPFTAQDNEKHGQLYVPIVEGDSAVIELVLQPGVAISDVELALGRISQGYWEFWKLGASKSGSCNVDVACDAANAWEDQIQSVAVIAIGSTRICTGQMLANTSGDDRPLFLTANHCQINSSNDAALIVYWNYENPTCRPPGSPASGGIGDGSLNQAQTGATLLAHYASSDFTLLELDDQPKPEYNVFWTGWDQRDQTFSRGVGIHHPQTHEKRISFENDPLVIVDGDDLQGLVSPAASIPRSHLQVSDWDLGTTEKGSSGSGLWNPQHRLIGQLHGGLAFCGNDLPDWYGRLAVSWTGGGTPQSSLRSWLDPLGSQAQFIDGYYACEYESFGIQTSPANPQVGQTVTFAANPPPGVSLADLTLRWDLDGDGHLDATGATVQTRYAKGFDGAVRLSINDQAKQCGASVSKSLKVQAAAIEVVERGQPAEICGDGDVTLEAGERWSVDFTVTNSGAAAADDVAAVFTRARVIQDEFGHSLADSSAPSCPYQFVDISTSANEEPFVDPVYQSIPADDEGATNAIALDNFSFYGSNVNAVVMSSNGYLATSTASDGGDYTNDCPLPATPDTDGGSARLAVYHEDLIAGAAYARHYDDCPRPPDTPDAGGACQVLQWNDVAVIGPPPAFEVLGLPAFKFQAILYEGSNQIVYQYGAATPQSQASATVGIQNAAANDGLTYACQSESNTVAPAHPAGASAVCFFDPKSSPAGANQGAVHLDTPALAFGDMAAGAQSSATLAFTVDAAAACGDVIGIDLHGFVSEHGFSPGPGLIFNQKVGGAEGQCDAVASCPAAKAAPIAFDQGLWFNPQREGHGADVSIGSGNGVVTWYTFDTARNPVWYQAVASYQDNQIQADLLRYAWDGDSAESEDVGEVIFTVLDANDALFSWTLDGEKSGEYFEWLEFAVGTPATDRSGLWYPPQEPGWGVTFSDQGFSEVGVLYFYEQGGQPVWALGSAEALMPGTIQMTLQQYSGTCPACPWVKQTAVDAGTVTRSFSSDIEGTLSTDMTLQPPLQGAWKKGPMEIEILTDPRG